MNEAYAQLLERFKASKIHARFIKDMMEHGIPVRVYSARGGYGVEIPAATTSDDFSEQDIIRATKVELRRDAMGRRVVLYP